MQKFEDFGLSTEMLNALSKKGFEEPSEIQKLVLPELLKNALNRTSTDRDRKNSGIWHSNPRNY